MNREFHPNQAYDNLRAQYVEFKDTVGQEPNFLFLGVEKLDQLLKDSKIGIIPPISRHPKHIGIVEADSPYIGVVFGCRVMLVPDSSWECTFLTIGLINKAYDYLHSNPNHPMGAGVNVPLWKSQPVKYWESPTDAPSAKPSVMKVHITSSVLKTYEKYINMTDPYWVYAEGKLIGVGNFNPTKEQLLAIHYGMSFEKASHYAETTKVKLPYDVPTEEKGVEYEEQQTVTGQTLKVAKSKAPKDEDSGYTFSTILNLNFDKPEK